MTEAAPNTTPQTAGEASFASLGREGWVLRLHVAPGAKRNAIGAVRGGWLRVQVHAPPVDGKANAAVLALLAERLNLRARDLALLSGEGARDKRVLLRGDTRPPDALLAALLPS